MSQSLQTQNLIFKLSEILEYCNNIEMLLDSDIKNFSQNNLQAFLSNNEKEMLEIEKIGGVLDSIKELYRKVPDDNLANLIKAHTHNLDSASKNEVNTILKAIGAKASTCYNMILSNNHVMFKNVVALKTLFHHLQQAQQGPNTMYTENGKLV